ncbi:MAG TPA: hypothetical protein VHV08_16535 [Pirellulales bacterium]|nr:hypothetical protein [Pirellulales bacterium]
MIVRCCVVALAAILMPTCLLGQERQDSQGQERNLSRGAEARRKLRNEVEENWVRQYRAISPSESMKIRRESTQLNPEEAKEMVPSVWRKKARKSPLSAFLD